MGRPIGKPRPTGTGWAPLVILPVGVIALVPAEWPRWLLMWMLAVAIYGGCKWLTWRRSQTVGVLIWRHLGYLLGWPGLDARAFLTDPPTLRPTTGEWLFAAVKLGIGVVLVWVVSPQLTSSNPLIRGWVGMVGLVFLLHFGSLHLLSCAWRSVGVNAKPLMNWPVRSVSLAEFWGQRWNTAFRDFTHRFLFRPLTNRLGARWGLLAGFLFSGIVHDVVISYPAGGGYGGPTLYFMIQGVGLLSERTVTGRRFGLGRGWAGHCFTLFVVTVPAGLLFHPPFVVRVVVPLLDVLTGGGGS